MIIFSGVAGSGKSVQGKMLADMLELPWLSTGEFLRMIIAGEPRRRMIEGKLLDDQEIIAVTEKIFSLIDVRKEFVLDGFPRSLTQAHWLLEFSEQQQSKISVVYHLVADEATVRDRLLARGRKDDHAEAITARFHEYDQTIKPILELFESRNIPVKDINANQSVDQVHQAIMEAAKAAIPLK